MGGFIAIVGIVLMVVIHEGAHFLAAKAFDMKATEAFFGFGPKLWSTRRGETEYGVKAIPFGGYVRIIGMNPFEEVDPDEEERTYRYKPFWQKSVVVLAGIFSHFIVAFVLFWVIAFGFGLFESTPQVAQVVAEVDGVPSPAVRAGLEPGDVLVAVDGIPATTWDGFVDLIHERPNQNTTITVARDGASLDLTTTLVAREGADGIEGFLGVSPQRVQVRQGPIASLSSAADDLWFATRENVRGLWDLVSNIGNIIGAAFGQNEEILDEVRPVSVIGIAQLGADADQGLAWTLGLIAWVNVFVGILNFVPLYPLDGGHFAVAAYERLRRRPADVRKLLPIAAAVFAFLVLLGLLGVYFDIVRPLRLG